MPDTPKRLLDNPLVDGVGVGVDALTGTAGGTLAVLGMRKVDGLIANARNRKIDRCYEEMIASWVRITKAPRAEVESIRFDRMLDDEQAQDRLFDTFRSMANARSEATYPYIATLTAPYILEGRKPDDFFRRTASLLEECEQEDIAILLDALRSSRALLAELNPSTVGLFAEMKMEMGMRASPPATDGIEWAFSDQAGLYLQTNPAPLIHAHLLHGVHEPARVRELLTLLGRCRIGISRNESIYFPPPDGGILAKLIQLFIPGEEPREIKLNNGP